MYSEGKGESNYHLRNIRHTHVEMACTSWKPCLNNWRNIIYSCRWTHYYWWRWRHQ